jgi:maltokinase
MTPTALEAVAQYVESARWFGGKGRGLTVTDARRVGLLGDPEKGWPVVCVELVSVD